MERKYKYKAFISYRHLKVDAAIASKIQQELEQFKVPKGLDPDNKFKDIRVFRDREELTTKDLNDSIEEALRQSEFLIIVLSKRTKLSKWCMREVTEFRKTHSDHNIIPVLIEGEPEDSFGDELLNLKSKEIDQDGNENIKDLQLLAADLRDEEVKDPLFIGYEKLEENDDNKKLDELIKKSKKILKETEIYRIMATMLGVNFGDLKQRNRERRLKKIIKASIFAGIFLTFVAIAMTSLYIKADRSQRLAYEQNSLMTLKNADEKLKSGNRAYSILIANEALNGVDKKMGEYNKIESEYHRILNDAIFSPKYSSKIVFDTNSSSPLYSIVKENEQILVAGKLNLASVYDISNGELIKEFEFGSNVTALINSIDFKNSYVSTQEGILYVIDNEKLEIVDKFKINPQTNTLRISLDNKYIFANVMTSGYEVYSIEEKKKLYSNQPDDYISYILTLDDDKYLEILNKGKIELKNIKDGKTIEKLEDESQNLFRKIAISKDNSLFAYTKKDSIVIYDIKNKTKKVIKSDPNITALCFNNDNSRLYMAKNSSLNYYDMKKEKKEFTIFLSTDINSMKFDNQGKNLYIKLEDKNSIAVIENIEDDSIESFDKKIKECYGSEHSDNIYSLYITNDDKNIITASYDSQIKITSTETNLSNNLIKGNIKAISSDSNTIYLIDREKNSYVYDFDRNEKEFLGQLSDNLTQVITRYAISNGGDYVAISMPYEQSVRVFNKEGIKLYDTKKHNIIENKDIITEVIYDIKINDNTNKIYTLGEDGLVYESNLKDGKYVKSLGEISSIPKNILLSDNGDLLAINYYDQTSKIYSTKDNKLLKDLRGEIYYISSKDGNIDKIRGGYGRKIFEIKDDKLVSYDSNNERNQVSRYGIETKNIATKDGKYLLNGIKGKIVVTDLSTGLRVKTLDTDPEESSLEPDGYMSFDNSKIIYNYDKDHVNIVENLSDDSLRKEAKKIIKDRKLNEYEKEEIGIVDRSEDEK